VYKSIYKQTGDVLKEKMLDGLKPALVETINAEFATVEGEVISTLLNLGRGR